MSTMKTSIGDATFAQVLASRAVSAAILAAAGERFARAQYLAYKSGRMNFGNNMRVTTGVRPGSKAKYGQQRPYARIESSVTAEELAADNRTAKLSRTQIMRRSA